jgi:membrane-associated protease RseP (regulator of RpoE activity)
VTSTNKSSSSRFPSGRARTFEIPLPIKVDSLTEVMRIQGVGVYLHWTIILIAVLILLNVIRHPLASLLGLAAYLGVLLIHESGHLIAAQKMRCEVFSIELYPIFGFCRFETPWSRFDHCVIAWGGVIAQAVVAAPIVLYVGIFGYTRFQPVNAVLALLGFFSLGVAAFNLLPIPRLDGSVAWGIIPEAIKRLRTRNRKSPAWKH